MTTINLLALKVVAKWIITTDDGGKTEKCQRATAQEACYSCTECSYTSKRRDHLKRHMTSQHEVNTPAPTTSPFEGCDIKMIRKDHLRHHLSSVHEVDPSDYFPSPNKQRSQQNSYTLQGGTAPSAKNFLSETFKCLFPGCDAELSRKDHLSRHIKNVHKKDPREVIGHLYSKPRSVGEERHSVKSLSSSDCTKSPTKKKQKRKWEDADGGDSDLNQPHHSMLSNYNYENAVTTEEIEKGLTLCALCCYSFYRKGNDEIEMDSHSLSNNFHLNEFFKELFQQEQIQTGVHSPSAYIDLFSSSKSSSLFSVCLDCISRIKAAMDKKMRVDKVEIEVRRLQLEVVKETKKLQENLREYSVEMEKIETIVQQSDMPCLESFFWKNLVLGRKEHNSMALSLRDRIVSVSKQLQVHKKTLEKTMRGCGSFSQRLRTRKIDAVAVPTKEVNIENTASANYPIKIENTTENNTEETSTVREIDNDPFFSFGSKPPLSTVQTLLQPDTNDGVANDREGGNVSDNSDFGENSLHDNDSYESDDGSDQDFNVDQVTSDSDEESVASGYASEEEDSMENSVDKPSDDLCSSVEPADQLVKSVFSCPINDCDAKLSRRGHLNRHIRYVHGMNPAEVSNQTTTVPMKKYKPRKRSEKIQMQSIDGVDVTNCSKFKRKIMMEVHKRKRRREKVESSYTDEDIRDPRLSCCIEYKPATDNFTVGSIPVTINEEECFLECSKCNYRNTDYTAPASAKPGKLPCKSIIMEKHIQFKHLSVFRCLHCGSVLASFTLYKDHMKGHQKKIVCLECNKVYFTRQALVKHNWLIHMTEQEIAEALAQGKKDPRIPKKPSFHQCTTCGKVCNEYAALKVHEETHLDVRERIMCSGCGKMFYKTTLAGHQKYSCFPDGQEPERAQCKLCPCHFKSKILLQRHIQGKHSQAALERAYKCPICGKSFENNSGLFKHKQTHTDERPYECRKGCGATYKNTRNRSRHEKSCVGQFSGKSVARKRQQEVEEHDSEDITKQESF